MPHRARTVAALAFLAACGGGGGGSTDGSTDAPAPLPRVFGGSARPATLNVPDGYDATQHYPLVMILHGYGATGFLQESYFGLKAEVTAGSALEIAPDGLIDGSGHQYWNADPACCDMDGANPDDSGYLGKLLTDIIAAYSVDPDRVFIVGHSNGGYMAYRMACDHADTVTAIGVLAGIAPTNPAVCPPTQAVNVLHMHGTDDDEVPYPETPTYAGAIGSVTRFAGYDGCGSGMTMGGTLDLDDAVAGAETQISTFSCPSPAAAELWTLNGSTHVPAPSAAFEPALWGWLMTHPR